ncbi:hypothetical protein [Piscinibacter terrae]|nr:hypothetical protein [Albitalea terrae]
MDILLVEGDAARSQGIADLLAHGTQRVIRLAEAPMAGGAFWPRHELTSAVLLGFEAPTTEKLRVLKRLWACDCAPPSFIVTRPDSAGERLLSALRVDRVIRGDWSVRGLRPSGGGEALSLLHLTAQLHLRPAGTLTLERLIALERVVRRDEQDAIDTLRIAA